VKHLREDRGSPLFGSNEDLALAGKTSKDMIDQLTRQIHKIAGAIVQRVELKKAHHRFSGPLFLKPCSLMTLILTDDTASRPGQWLEPKPE
jgi:hypothetical protein